MKCQKSHAVKVINPYNLKHAVKKEQESKHKQRNVKTKECVMLGYEKER